MPNAFSHTATTSWTSEREALGVDRTLARIDACTCFHDLLFFHRQGRPEQAAVRDGFAKYSYADLLDRAEQLAARLVSHGLEPGDRIALWAKNNVAFVDLMMAASMTGLVLVPLNFRLASPELDFILRDTGARLIFAGAEFLDTARAVQSGCETCEATVAITPDGNFRHYGANSGKKASTILGAIQPVSCGPTDATPLPA